MIKKALHIAIITILIISVTGLSAEASICACLKKKAPKSCCQKKKEENERARKCCKKTSIVYKADRQLAVSNPEVQVPDFISDVNPLFVFNEVSPVEEIHYSGQRYNSPPGIRDIPVLIQCFRN